MTIFPMIAIFCMLAIGIAIGIAGYKIAHFN